VEVPVVCRDLDCGQGGHDVEMVIGENGMFERVGGQLQSTIHHRYTAAERPCF